MFFSETVNEAIRQHIPLKKGHIEKSKRYTNKRFYPRYIKDLIKMKAVAWKKWKTTGVEIDKIAYKDAEKNSNFAIKQYHSAKELELIRQNNIGSFYKFINNKLNAKNKIGRIKNNLGNLTSDDKEKSEIFSEFFASVYTRDDGNNPVIAARHPPGCYLSSIAFTPSIVYSVLKKLKPTTSVGPDGIPNILLKNCARSLQLPLSHLFDSSFKDGTLPDSWKTANVVPIYKKGCATDPNNYRPISLTSTSCKVMERIINNDILKYLIRNSLISKQQHGFISGRSSSTNLLECMQEWTKNFERRLSTHIIYFDLKKAFDSVSYPKLLNKINAYGLNGTLFAWLQNFLSGRTQQVRIGSELSSATPVISGVPQGSVLGPTLFLVFINDVCDEFLDLPVGVKLFADDLKIYSNYNTNTGPNSLQTAIDRFCSWCDRWQLSIAPQKCFFLKLNPAHDHNPALYLVNNTLLKEVSSANDLGICIDEKLKFDGHISSIVHKAMNRAFLIRKCFHSGDGQLLTRAFLTYVRPLLEYACPVWSPRQKYLIEKLEGVQRHFTKRIPGLWNLSYEERLAQLNLQPLAVRREGHDLRLVYNIVHKNTDTTLSSVFQPSASTCTRGHAYKLQCQYSGVDTTKYFFCNRVVKLWNELPMDAVSARNVLAFKRFLRSYYTYRPIT